MRTEDNRFRQNTNVVDQKRITRGTDVPRKNSGMEVSTKTYRNPTESVEKDTQRTSAAKDQNSNRRSLEDRERYYAFREAKRKRALKKRRNKLLKKIGVGLTALVSIILILVILVFESPIKKGTEYLESNEYDKAIGEFTKGLSDIDYIAESYKGIGIAYYELGQYKDAVDNLENAIQKGETSLGTTYYLLAISYMKIEDYDNALKNITTALSKSENSQEMIQELRYNEVLCMELTSDWDGAKAKATSYLQSYPDDVNMVAEYKFLSTR